MSQRPPRTLYPPFLSITFNSLTNLTLGPFHHIGVGMSTGFGYVPLTVLSCWIWECRQAWVCPTDRSMIAEVGISIGLGVSH